MFICICNGVTEKQIHDAVCDGASCLSDLSSQLGVGAGCGTCRAFAAEVLNEAKQRQDMPENRVAA